MSGNTQKNEQLHPTFRRKQVYLLDCAFCGQTVCRRAMKAVLLADTKTEMYSTDSQEKGCVDVTGEKFYTGNCNCQIENMACMQCGNTLGYHVRLPCLQCLKSCNNGHFWMYTRAAVVPSERLNYEGEEILLWGDLPSVTKDYANVMIEDECYR